MIFFTNLKPKTYHLSPRGGQALIESIVAASVLTVGFLGVLALLARSLSLERVVADNYTATYLAAEGIEVVKNMIDANVLQGKPWNGGFSGGTGNNNDEYEIEYATDGTDDHPLTAYAAGHTLSFDPNEHLYSYSGSAPTNYVRKVSITFVSADEIAVRAQVVWSTRGGGNSEITLEDHFYNWRQ